MDSADEEDIFVTPLTSPTAPRRPKAPTYTIRERDLVAIEHPMIIKNIDKALKTFGTNRPFRRILDSDDPEECLPLYLRPHDPTAVPILSHNGTTNNILLQITVPKRTGRKRKRGSQDPYTESNGVTPSNGYHITDSTQNIRSQGRRDNPAELLRTLQDNVDNYRIEALGHISQTHRFRGLSDFHQSTSQTRFVPKLKETMLTGEVAKIQELRFDETVGMQEQNEEILPPPLFTGHTLPFNWAWLQNPNIFTEVDQVTGEKVLVNHSKPQDVFATYVSHDAKVLPTGPKGKLPNEPPLRALVAALNIAFKERPIWTRRGLANRIGSEPFFYLLRLGLQYVGYQFKGGPFRDAVIKFGVDPRTDNKYRIYQTLFFKMSMEGEKEVGMPWADHRFGFTAMKRNPNPDAPTHEFDGKNLTLDGKIWQLCDITDPLLAKIVATAPYREEFDAECDGWFTNGSIAKIRTIMKTKLMCILFGKKLNDEDFKPALDMPDIVPGEKNGRHVAIPVPSIKLTKEEIQQMRDGGITDTVKEQTSQKRMRRRRNRKGTSSIPTPAKPLGPLRRRGRPRNNDKVTAANLASRIKPKKGKKRVEMLPSEIWGDGKEESPPKKTRGGSRKKASQAPEGTAAAEPGDDLITSDLVVTAEVDIDDEEDISEYEEGEEGEEFTDEDEDDEQDIADFVAPTFGEDGSDSDEGDFEPMYDRAAVASSPA